jgi:2'-5' RNA ligase
VARHRLGVVLVVPEPWATEIDGLRRALGDEALDRVAPHLTLVPPVNVREEDLPVALDLVHAAARRCPVLDVALGPTASFAPVSPVAYLAVAAEPGTTAALVGLRDALRQGPLERPSDLPFVPHVTIALELPDDRLAAAVTALSEYRAEVRLDRLSVLAEQGDRTWMPVTDVALGAA